MVTLVMVTLSKGVVKGGDIENEKDCNASCTRRGDGGESGLLDDVLQDAGRQAVFAGRVREARCRRLCDDQGGTADGRRVQDPGVVSEDARRSTVRFTVISRGWQLRFATIL